MSVLPLKLPATPGFPRIVLDLGAAVTRRCRHRELLRAVRAFVDCR